MPDWNPFHVQLPAVDLPDVRLPRFRPIDMSVDLPELSNPLVPRGDRPAGLGGLVEQVLPEQVERFVRSPGDPYGYGDPNAPRVRTPTSYLASRRGRGRSFGSAGGEGGGGGGGGGGEEEEGATADELLSDFDIRERGRKYRLLASQLFGPPEPAGPGPVEMAQLIRHTMKPYWDQSIQNINAAAQAAKQSGVPGLADMYFSMAKNTANAYAQQALAFPMVQNIRQQAEVSQRNSEARNALLASLGEGAFATSGGNALGGSLFEGGTGTSSPGT